MLVSLRNVSLAEQARPKAEGKKLTDEGRAKALQRLADGASISAVAREMKACRATIMRVKLAGGTLSVQQLAVSGVEVEVGLPQKWGSGGNRGWRMCIVGGLESLSESGTERAVVDRAANLEQEIGTSSRPSHLLRFAHPAVHQKIGRPLGDRGTPSSGVTSVGLGRPAARRSPRPAADHQQSPPDDTAQQLDLFAATADAPGRRNAARNRRG
jgi:hypothetical protein